MGAALKSPPDELRRVVELLDAKDALLERARRAIAASAELRDKIQDGIDETYRLLAKRGFTGELLRWSRSPRR